MKYQFFTLDVFAEQKFEGNQLAVIPDAESLEDEQMQKIAKEFNYSETAFITQGDSENTWNVRIFTPASEIDFAGHPNIGAAMLLAYLGEFTHTEKSEIVFKEKVGNVPITVYFEYSKPSYAELTVPKLPQEGPPPPTREQIAEAISLESSDISSKQKSLAFSCGLPFLFVPIVSLNKLKNASINHEKWKKYISSYWAPQVYLITTDIEKPDSDFHARMFAPALGIPEDPATGSAVAAMSGYLSKLPKYQDGDFSVVIEQGFEINRPSILEMSFTSSSGKVEKVHVKGKAVVVSQGEIEA
jgi:trans-2,3-dihydro-3-hydroxyanthranilate isomerase